jgi:hypothetical protein
MSCSLRPKLLPVNRYGKPRSAGVSEGPPLDRGAQDSGSPGTVSLVSDRPEWIGGAVEVCAAYEVVPRHAPWSLAERLGRRDVAALVDATPPFGEKQTMMGVWARRAWQPICVVSIPPNRGAESIAAHASRLGYRFVYDSSGDRYWERLSSQLDGVIRDNAWLVPRVAAVLACGDPRIVKALAVAVSLPSSQATVTQWAARLGVRRQRLNETFSSIGLPQPGEVLSWLRLARVVDHAAQVGGINSRQELARIFSYGNADYLGKRAKAMTGVAFGQLAVRGVDQLLRLMQRRMVSPLGQSRRRHEQIDRPPERSGRFQLNRRA